MPPLSSATGAMCKYGKWTETEHPRMKYVTAPQTANAVIRKNLQRQQLVLVRVVGQMTIPRLFSVKLAQTNVCICSNQHVHVVYVQHRKLTPTSAHYTWLTATSIYLHCFKRQMPIIIHWHCRIITLRLRACPDPWPLAFTCCYMLSVTSDNDSGNVRHYAIDSAFRFCSTNYASYCSNLSGIVYHTTGEYLHMCMHKCNLHLLPLTV